MNNTIKTFIILALLAFIIACSAYSVNCVREGRMATFRFGMDYEKHMAWVHDREEYLKRVAEAKARKEAEEKAVQEKKEARVRQIEAEKARAK